MRAYLDASVLLPLIKREAASDSVGRFLAESDWEVFVSDFAAAEVASALSRHVRTGHLDTTEAAEFLDDFDEFRSRACSSCDLHAADARLASSFVRFSS